jgi:amino acid adenylation domain-containing protein
MGERFVVVRNGFGDCSVLPEGQAPPSGWTADGAAADLDECLARIRQAWQGIQVPAVCAPRPATGHRSGELLARFAGQVRDDPGAAAVIEGTRTYTYGELGHRSDAVAGWLRGFGAGPGTVVGIGFECGYDLVTSILGTWKAGAATVLVDIGAPARRNRHILADCGALAVLTHADLAPPDVTVLDLADLPAAPAEPGPLTVDDQEPLAYLTYTSGSTGEPKGVAMGEATLTNLVLWELDRMATRARAHGSSVHTGRNVLHYLRPTVDVTYQEIMATLCHGDCLVAVGGAVDRANPQHVVKLLERHQVERAYLPVMALGQLARAAMELRPSLRLWEVVTLSSKLQVTAELRDFFGSLDSPVLDDQYGSAEMQTVLGCVYSGDPAGWPAESAFPESMPSVRIVLSEPDNEICVRGIAVSRGYVGRPDLTAQRFVPDPEPPFPGARLYRTGDFGRRRADGAIEIHGRQDEQVKVRGFRIDLGEVEQNLLKVAGVARAAVVVVGQEEQRRLIAYAVPEEHGRQLTEAILRQDLLTVLPDYMVPAAFVLIDDLPLTPHGKVARDLLRAWEGSGVDADGLSPTEVVVGQIWSEVLGARVRGRDADFFTSGGNSVLATTVVARLRRHFGKDLAFDCFHTHPRLRDLADLVDRLPSAKPREIVPVPPQRPVAAGPALTGLLFHAEMAADPSVYNVSWAYRVHGPLRAELLREALDFLVARHDALRTVFGEDDGLPMLQVLARCPPGYFQARDTSAAGLGPLVDDLRTTPFDLSAGPLHRTVLLRLSDVEHVLLFTGHHVVFDSWSEGLMRTELGAVYGALAAGRRPALPEPQVGFRDYVAWLSECLDGGDLDRHRAYWAQELAGVHGSLGLPLRRPRTLDVGDTAAAVPVSFGREVSGRLREIAVRAKVTPFVLLLTIFGLALRRRTGDPEVIVGVPASGRTAVELQDIIGFFVNSLPIRMKWSGNSFPDALSVVRKATSGAFANQDLPFGSIVQASGAPRVLGANPLFNAWFVFDDFTEGLALTGVSTEVLPLAELTVRFDLALHVHYGDGELRGELTYRSELFERGEIEALAETLQLVAAEVVVE